MLQVVGPPGGSKLRQTAVEVISSFKAHPENDVNLWTAYGFEVETPRRFRLEKTQFIERVYSAVVHGRIAPPCG